MATDMFGNILSPEEEERLRLQHESLGLTPSALSSAVSPSLYPYQAPAYGSFGARPATGPYPISPFMEFRQEEPVTAPFDTSEPGPTSGQGSEPRLPWNFNQDPIAINQALSKPSFTEPLNVLNQQATGNITPTEDVNLAGMPFAGAVTGANELINKAPFVSANPLSVLAKTGVLSNLVNFDARPAVQNVFDTLMPTAEAQHGGAHRRGWFDPFFDLEMADEFTPPTIDVGVEDSSDSVPEAYYGVTDESNVSPTISSTIERNLNVDAMINKLGNAPQYIGGPLSLPGDELSPTQKMGSMLAGTGQQYGYNHPLEDMWDTHPFLSSEDAMFSQGMKQMQDYQDYGTLGGMGYTAKQLPDEITKALGLRGSLQPSSLKGLIAQLSSPMVGVQQENIPALVDDIVATRVHGITSANRPNFSTGALSPADINAALEARTEQEEISLAHDLEDMAVGDYTDPYDESVADLSGFVKGLVGKAKDALTVGGVTVGANKRGITFTYDIPPGGKKGTRKGGEPPNIAGAVAAALAKPAGPSAADIARQKQDAINARLAQEAIARQQQQQTADRERTRMRDIALEQERSALAREQERVRQAAVAAEQSRAAQARRAAEIIQQQQADKTAADQTARARQEVFDMLMVGRDRGEPSARDIDAAIQSMGMEFGGLLGTGPAEVQTAMRDVGYGGGFAAGRGDTGAMGQGGWT